MSEKVTSSILISGSGTPEPKVYMAAPEKIPINREEKTSLVIRARTIAIIGGRIDNQPAA